MTPQLGAAGVEADRRHFTVHLQRPGPLLGARLQDVDVAEPAADCDELPVRRHFKLLQKPILLFSVGKYVLNPLHRVSTG